VCAAINTETVATITAINRRLGRSAALAAVICDALTTIVMSRAWIMMLQMLMAPPIKNWRTMPLLPPTGLGTSTTTRYGPLAQPE
jgi:hypothetical protein